MANGERRFGFVGQAFAGCSGATPFLLGYHNGVPFQKTCLIDFRFIICKAWDSLPSYKVRADGIQGFGFTASLGAAYGYQLNSSVLSNSFHSSLNPLFRFFVISLILFKRFIIDLYRMKQVIPFLRLKSSSLLIAGLLPPRQQPYSPNH